MYTRWLHGNGIAACCHAAILYALEAFLTREHDSIWNKLQYDKIDVEFPCYVITEILRLMCVSALSIVLVDYLI